MSLIRSNVVARALPIDSTTRRVPWLAYLVIPVTLLMLAACGRDDRRVDELLKADLAAAAQAPSMRQQYASPQELGYPGALPQYPAPYSYAPAYSQGYPSPYPAPYPPQYPQPVVYQQPARVVYAPAPAAQRPRASSSGGGASASGGAGSGAGSAAGQAAERNTQRGAIIGAATGAAVGIATSRDKVKGGAVGAVAGAVLGGVVGSQIYTKPPR